MKLVFTVTQTPNVLYRGLDCAYKFSILNVRVEGNLDNPYMRRGMVHAKKGRGGDHSSGVVDLAREGLLALPEIVLQSVPRLGLIHILDPTQRFPKRRLIRCAERVQNGLAFEYGVVQYGLALIARRIVGND